MTDVELLRHTLATVAYRGGKALRGAPPSFAGFEASPGGRRPIHILSHLADLYEWALSMANGTKKWNEASPQSWDQETERFFRALAAFDTFLASGQPLQAPVDRLFQGPVADSLTHIGQLAMMRRLHGTPTVGENYYVAEIVMGRVGPEQPPPKKPFA